MATFISLIIAGIMYGKEIYYPEGERILILDKLTISLMGLKETVTVGFSGAINPIVHSITFIIINNVIAVMDERAFAPLSIVGSIANFAILPLMVLSAWR